ncbi:MAG: hypothetical protein HFH68_00690 [Lachnospiraceae bacterium]|nr:hypothetical protein [Lachnospiraceae bacterium]
MKIKRVLQGTVLTAFASIAWYCAGSAGVSAAVSIQDITFDVDSNSLDVRFDGPELMAGVAKVDSNKKAKVATWDVYDESDKERSANKDSIKIDLSKLNVIKDNYIAVMTNDMEQPLYLKLAKTAKRNVVTFYAHTAKINQFKADGTDIQEIEYRRLTDSWGERYNISELDFSGYQYQGATLYVRVPGVNKLKDISGSAYEDLKDGTVDINTVKGAAAINVSVYNIGSLPGKEIKLNIAKQANGPAVPADYKKATVTINKNLEFRVIKESGIVSHAAIGSKEIKSVEELLGKDGSVPEALSGIIEVRRCAVTTGRGKCASKWTRVKIEKPKELLLDSSKTENINAATVEKTVNISTTAGAVIEAGYKLNSKKTAVTHLFLTNKSEDIYEYFIGSSIPETNTSGVKSIAKGKTVSIKQDDVNGKNIYIRLAGDKKVKRWAGAWKEVGTKITIPSVTASK